MKNYIPIIIFMLASVSTIAQTITLEFPHFAGQTYDFKIFQGDKQIVLKKDTIPKGGKLKLVIPEAYAGYKGIAQWYFTNRKTGGGLDLIINKKDFSVSCLDSIPNQENIIYKNNSENTFSVATFSQQQALFAKHDAMLAAIRAYPKKHKLYKTFDIEYADVKKECEDYFEKLAASPLYAARFQQIVNLTMGIGTIITLDEKEKANNVNDFIVRKLDFEALYTSNHWGGIISNWVELQKMVIKDDTKFLQDARTLLKRLPTDKIYTEFVVNLTKELSRAGKDNLLADLTPDIKNSKRLLNYDGILNMYQQDLTGKAPNLKIVTHLGKLEDHNHSTKTIETDKLETKNTLLVFHKSGCGPCEETMESLKNNYKDLIAKGFKIISLAADTEQEVFQNTSFNYPWADKYCDLKGMNGINFKNYAVIGTPTMYILDNKGFVVSKLATVTQLLDWVRAH